MTVGKAIRILELFPPDTRIDGVTNVSIDMPGFALLRQLARILTEPDDTPIEEA